jgi:peptidoglycan LD-endopeptidase LytH
MKRAIVVGILILIALTAWQSRTSLLRLVPTPLVPLPPHDQYALALSVTGVAATDAGRAWTAAAERALVHPPEVPLQHERDVAIATARHDASAWRFQARRGQRITIEVSGTGEVFVDLFTNDGTARVDSAPAHSTSLSYIAGNDEPLVARVQAPLAVSGEPNPATTTYRVTQRVEASLLFPVPGRTGRAVQSGFGAGRDSGRRRHEGIDIFAPRGTPVVAAADGWITRQTSNRLGGNVVWLFAPGPRVSLYYAHLDAQAVRPGDRVDAGEVVGYVGNTGNARTTAPHLHFGVYAPLDGAVDPLPYVVSPPLSARATRQ